MLSPWPCLNISSRWLNVLCKMGSTAERIILFIKPFVVTKNSHSRVYWASEVFDRPSVPLIFMTRAPRRATCLGPSGGRAGQSPWDKRATSKENMRLLMEGKQRSSEGTGHVSQAMTVCKRVGGPVWHAHTFFLGWYWVWRLLTSFKITAQRDQWGRYGGQEGARWALALLCVLSKVAHPFCTWAFHQEEGIWALPASEICSDIYYRHSALSEPASGCSLMGIIITEFSGSHWHLFFC